MLEQRGGRARMAARRAQVPAHQAQHFEADQRICERRLVVEACRERSRLLQERKRIVRQSVTPIQPPTETERGAHPKRVALSTLRQAVGERADALVVRDRLVQSAIQACAVSRSEVIAGGLRRYLSALEVHGQLRGDLFFSVRITRLEPLPEFSMPRSDRRRRAPHPRRVFEQRVAECVPRLYRAIRPGLGPDVAEESSLVRERLTRRVDAVGVGVERVGDQPGGEGHAGDRRYLDDSLFDRWQSIDLRVDQPANTVGPPGRDVLHARRKLPLAVTLAEEALRFQIVHQCREEERIPARRLVERSGERGREAVVRETLRQVGVDGLDAETVERDGRRLPMRDELARELRNGVPAWHLGGSIGAEDEQSRWL